MRMRVRAVRVGMSGCVAATIRAMETLPGVNPLTANNDGTVGEQDYRDRNASDDGHSATLYGLQNVQRPDQSCWRLLS